MSDTTTNESAKPTRFEPPVSEASQPFWDATREERFLIQWCTACDQVVFYPRENCPSCLGTSFEWKQASGKGTVYASSVQHRAANPLMANRVPYVVAMVELEEGIRIMSNVIDCAPDDVVVGQAVQLTWEPLSDGRNLPQFSPLQEG